jgi:ABC-2 type transport system ATP-binding protein
MAVAPSPAEPRDGAPDPGRWAVEVFRLEKRFITRQGLPMGWGFGDAHWIISSLIKYRKAAEWCRAVDGADLRVARGELLGLLGPNGAGKTTLIKCLATLLAVDAGEAYVNGYSVRTQPDQVRLSMNLVGSGHWIGFDWGMTVTQNLHFFGSLFGLDRTTRRARIEETLERLGMAHLAKDTPRTLSSGERQRMLLAKGFMIRTPVFFLDEPTVGLDPAGIQEVCTFIKQELIGSTGTSGLLTTHRMTEAEALCSRIAIMHRGRIIACGTPLELKTLAGEGTILDIRAKALPPAAVSAVRQLGRVRAALAAPAGGDRIEESLRVHCEDTTAVLDRIMDTLRRHGVDILTVDVQNPTLEDAFIALTDRRLE